jgi:hypothetical protein
VGRDEGADFLGMWRDNLLFGQHTHRHMSRSPSLTFKTCVAIDKWFLGHVSFTCLNYIISRNHLSSLIIRFFWDFSVIFNKTFFIFLRVFNFFLPLHAYLLIKVHILL